MEEEIFKRYIPDYNKLIDYGFKKTENKYEFQVCIFDNTFKINIYIKDNELKGSIIDLEFDEEYTNFRLENNNGSFSNKIKSEYEKILIDIRNNCFILNNFISNQANRISNILYEKYNSLPSYEWDREPNDAVFKNNGKWYALIMNIDRSKINAGLGNIDILNIKLNPDKILELLNIDGFYPAYHMNKKYWITIELEDVIADDFIIELIEESYSYTNKK